MKTIKEIAQECGVSPATVSNILNGKPKMSEETRRRVLKVMEEAGYQPNYMAQGLRRSRAKIVGIIAEDIAQFSSPPMIESVMGFCEEKGYQTVVKNMRLYNRWGDTWYDQDTLLHSVLDPIWQEMDAMKVSGIVYLAGHARIISCVPRDYPLPVAMAYAYSGSGRIPSVVIDDEKTGFECTRYLIGKGHKKIGVMGGRSDNLHTQKRLLGFQKALYVEGLPYNPDRVCYANWTRESAYAQMPKLMEQDITAIFSMSDEMSGGIYDYIREAGGQPGRDISVVSINNHEIAAYFYPALTAMTLPLSAIGKKTAELLIDRIENGVTEAAEPEVVYIPCWLKERDSVQSILA